MKILLRSATIVDATNPHHQKSVDIYINNGIIEKIGASIAVDQPDREINIQDLHVSRGWFDSSVSFGEPGYEERETIVNGLNTAAKSGFTAIALNPNTQPVIDDNGMVTSLLSKARKSPVNLYPIGALTTNSEGKNLAELYDMNTAGAIAFGDYKKPVSNPNLLKLALQYVQNFEGTVLSFPQNNDIAGKGVVNEDENSTKLGLKGIAPLAEELQVARDLAILEYTGGKLHIPTISTTGSLKLIKAAKKRGLDVSCSVALHNLIFTDDILTEFNTNAKVLPPLRTKQDKKSLLAGVKDGSIDMVTSDHTPVDVEHKKVEFEHALYGTIGLESMFGALHTLFSLEETIKILTSGRNRFGIPEPEIKEGAVANLSLFSGGNKHIFNFDNIFSTSKNSLFLNSEIRGKVYGIIKGAKVNIVE